MKVNGAGASAFAKQRYISWVTAKPVNVLMNPFEGQQLIFETSIAIDALLGQVKEAQCAQTVVDCDNDHFFLHNVFGRVKVAVAAAGHKATAMNPDHHRQCVWSLFRVAWQLRRIDIQMQAIL